MRWKSLAPQYVCSESLVFPSQLQASKQTRTSVTSAGRFVSGCHTDRPDRADRPAHSCESQKTRPEHCATQRLAVARASQHSFCVKDGVLKLYHQEHHR